MEATPPFPQQAASTGTPVDAAEHRARLTLNRCRGIGPHRFQQLIERFGSAQATLTNTQAQLRAAGVPDSLQSALLAPDEAGVEQDLKWLQHPRHHCLHLGSAHYPPQLARTDKPPAILYVAGDPETLLWPQLAVVGSRNPDPVGIATATAFARHLSSRGLAITSGLAQGIDTCAHQGAMQGSGITIAVLGHGLDRVYPRSNRELAGEIAERGAIVSQFPLGVGPRPGQFPQRNTVIAGLSLGTLVVEATVRSGSLITARLAMEAGREVMAIPGSIHNPLARGCHQLIKQGAKLVQEADDVLEELGPLLESSALTGTPNPATAASAKDQTQVSTNKPEPDPDYEKLLAALGHESCGIDQLVQRSGLSAQAISSMLLILEVQGRVASVAGGQYTLVPDAGQDKE